MPVVTIPGQPCTADGGDHELDMRDVAVGYWPATDRLLPEAGPAGTDVIVVTARCRVCQVRFLLPTRSSDAVDETALAHPAAAAGAAADEDLPGV